MNRLFIFDMDGTLLPQTTGMLQIAKILGQCEQLERLERHLFDKIIDNKHFAESIYELWKTIKPTTVKKAFIQAPKLKNIKKGLKKIEAAGGTSCLITSSPEFFAHHFYDYGFDYIFASKPFDLVEREFTPEHILHAKDKPLMAQALCEKLDLSFKDAVAFGDSHSDIPLFQSLTHTVSVNGDDHIKQYAKHHYIGLDLMEALACFPKGTEKH